MRAARCERDTAAAGPAIRQPAFRRGQEIIIEGKTYRTLFIVIEGVAIRYRILRDGRRHVLSVLLPGDIAGITACFFESSLYSVKRSLIPGSRRCPSLA